MKKSLALMATAAVTLIHACSPGSDELPALGTGSGPSATAAALAERAIAFSVGTDSQAVTRTATGTITTDGSDGLSLSLHDTGFGIFACYTGQHKLDVSTVTCDFMYNQQINYVGTQWTYTPVKYWPVQEQGKNADYISFFAYGPYAGTPGTASYPNHCITDFSLPYEVGQPWLTYRLADDPLSSDVNKQQVDLLFAASNDEQRPSKNYRVGFTFRHALACFGSKVTTNTTTYATALTDYNSLRTLYQKMIRLQARTAGVYMPFIALSKLTFDVQCITQARLVLNTGSTPVWQPISNAASYGSRSFSINRAPTAETYVPSDYPAVVTAVNAAANNVTRTSYTENSAGLFLIPLTVSGQPQTAAVTGEYSLVVQKTNADLSAGDKAGWSSTFKSTLTTPATLTLNAGQSASGLPATLTANTYYTGTAETAYSASTFATCPLVIHDAPGGSTYDILTDIFAYDSQYYTGSQIRPTVIVYGPDGGYIPGDGIEGYTLSVTYSNNITAYDDDTFTDPNPPTVTIKVSRNGTALATITKHFLIKNF